MNECLSPKVALAVFSLQDEENWQSFFLSSNFWFLPCSNPKIERSSYKLRQQKSTSGWAYMFVPLTLRSLYILAWNWWDFA